jgi:selenocysteine lyase/cysteine desulfurase
MTVSEILANEELRRHEFPVAREHIFLAHAGVCPIPRRVAESIRSYAELSTRGDQETLVPAFEMHQTRELAARLLHAQADEVAFVGPTSLALSLIAAGLPLTRRDNIVIYFDDYPSNVYPWMALADKGVQVRLVQTRELGRIRPVDVFSQVDEQTRLVALASCHFATGYRIDLNAVGKELHQRGILFCVDAIQTLGAFPTTVEEIDFLAADAHKWLLGPCAAGLLYVRKSLQSRLRPPIYGWNNVRCPDFIAQEEMVFWHGARRYEAGSANLLGLVGLRAALELIQEVGVSQIAQELLRKHAWLVPALQAKGYTVLQANAPPENASGIITLHRADTDIAALHQRLTEANIITSLRADRSGRKLLRLSPHFYNTDEELHRLLEAL